jgi:hypothetical protein
MRKVKTYYKSLTQAEFEKLLTQMLLSLTNNANFPSLPIALSVISGKQTEWQIELNHSKQGNHESTSRASDLHNELIGLVKINGDYINNTARGNVSMLQSSGYTMAKERVYKKKPMIRIIQGEISGSGKIVIKSMPGAAAYLVDIVPDPMPKNPDDAAWKRLKLSTQCTIPFTGFEPLRKYWARFCYVTGKGEAPYSKPIWFSVI